MHFQKYLRTPKQYSSIQQVILAWTNSSHRVRRHVWCWVEFHPHHCLTGDCIIQPIHSTNHRPHSRQVTGARCTEVAARQSWAEYSSSLEEYSLGLDSRYSTVRSVTLTWREWGLWHKPCAYLLGRTVHDNLDCLPFYKRMQRFIIIDFIWYQIGNVPVCSYIIELVVLRFKHRMDLIYFLCMTFIWLMLLNPHTLQPKVNTSWKITWISNVENHIRKMANNNGVRFSPCLTTHVTITIIRYFAVHFRRCVPRRIVSLLWSAPTSAGKPQDPHAPLWPASPENDSRAITHLYSKRDKFVTIRCLRALSIQKYASHIHVDDQWMIEGSTIVALIWCHKLWRCLRGWLVVWRRQGINWSDVYLPSICTSNTSNFHYTSVMKNWKQNL